MTNLSDAANSVFKAYDIRGIAGEPLNAHLAKQIGAALAVQISPKSIAVGRDIRVSSPELANSLIDGLVHSGVNVIDLGVVPTGAMYHATHHLDVDGGVMVTASHNPPEYNGFKINRGTSSMAGDAIIELRDIVSSGKKSTGKGQVEKYDIIEDMLNAIVASSGIPMRPMSIVVDAGNAVPGPAVARLMDLLNVNATLLYCDPDPTFPNHPPDPTRPSNMVDLAQAVISECAEFGIGIDGDGDRIGIVDERGQFISPDRLLTLFAIDTIEVARANEPNSEPPIIFDVKCSMSLEESIIAAGGKPIMMRTGHSFLKQALKDLPSCPFAGEMSGHFFFNDNWPGYDDALYASARLLELVSRDPSPENGGPTISQRLSIYPNYPATGEVKIPLKGLRNELMNSIIDRLDTSGARLNTSDGVRARWADGWFLCRPSNTEPILVMRAEGRSKKILLGIAKEIEEKIGDLVDLSTFLSDIPA